MEDQNIGEFKQSVENQLDEIKKERDEMKKDILKIFEYIEKEVLSNLIYQNTLMKIY